ncbi:MAG: N-acetyl-gamma-glutamyl-phosphate reductase [Thermoplasmata archaeon]
MVNATVFGATGYLGGELLRLLASHPGLTVSQIISHSHAGEKLSDHAPNLDSFGELRFEGDASPVDADVAFLAQPAGEAMKVVPGLLERGVKVIDLGPDYRLRKPEEYARVYGRDHADPSHLDEAVYGLPELFRERIRSARLVANPGCYPTATLIALAPLLEKGAIGGPIVVDAKSGTSGVGASPTPTSHHPEAALTVVPYGTPEHRHLPEMIDVLDRQGVVAPPITFVPHLIPVVRGILCSIYPTGTPRVPVDQWTDVMRHRYADSKFVRVGAVPKLAWAQGTNRCYLSVQRAGDAPVVFSALDNLGKGGAAQAIQNANLMFGWDEADGLGHAGFGV